MLAAAEQGAVPKELAALAVAVTVLMLATQIQLLAQQIPAAGAAALHLLEPPEKQAAPALLF